MLLTIAVENTRTVVGLLDGDRVVRTWLVGTDDRRSADEWSVLLTGLLTTQPTGEAPSQTAVQDTSGATGQPTGQAATAGRGGVDGIAVCSAVPSVLRELREVAGRYYAGVRAVFVEPGIKTGLPMMMDNPREVGADRIANAVAAAALYGARGPCVVVDVGTATTYDVVSGKGQYVGGVIAPGIEISLDALHTRAAQLRKVELVRPRTVVARNTVEAMQSGAVFGAAAQIDGIVGRILTEQGWHAEDVTVVATGALAPVVIGDCPAIDKHEPWLTLHGLRLVHTRNA